MQRRQEDRPPAQNEKSFNSLPRMSKSSTRLGVGHFFVRNSGAGGCGLALQMFRVCVFPGASRPKILQEFSKNSEKFAKMHQIPPSAGEPGGTSLILGPPWYIVLRKGPHIIDVLKSESFSIFFLKNGENQKIFSRDFEIFRRRAAIITLPDFWKKLSNFEIKKLRLFNLRPKS